MHLCKNEVGLEYLFKPARQKFINIEEPFRAEAQVVAAKLQQIISPETAVKCELANIGGVEGTIQPRISIDVNKTEAIKKFYLDGETLDENIARQFMREYVVDYLLANYDAHFRNFIVDERGNLRGIDKEQALRYIGDEEAKGDLKFDKYHPNAKYGEYPPIYGKIFECIDEGKMSPEILDEVSKGIKRIRAIPKDEYLSMFTPYVNTLTDEEEKRQQLCENIWNRYESLREVEKMIAQYRHKEPLTALSAKLYNLRLKAEQLFPTRGKEGERSEKEK